MPWGLKGVCRFALKLWGGWMVSLWFVLWKICEEGGKERENQKTAKSAFRQRFSWTWAETFLHQSGNRRQKKAISPTEHTHPLQQHSAGILGRGWCFPQTLLQGREGGGGGDLFLIKELVTVALVLADATNNNQDPVPLKCIINRLHSLLSTPTPTSFPFCFTLGCLHPKWHRNLSFLVSIQRNKWFGRRGEDDQGFLTFSPSISFLSSARRKWQSH